MRWIKAFGVLVFTTVALQAQFYAPATERHDPVQRMFVVEMARVIGWFENEKSPGIVEIKYEVTTKADGATAWQLKWIGADGKERFTAAVEYPATLLESGPEFYRATAYQVMSPSFSRRLQGAKAADVTASYWKGSGALGWSREETLEKALGIAGRFAAEETVAIPELAGALTHAPLFGMGGRLTIDSMTAARGAAWLAIAERMSAGKLDELWAPILFLGGREKAAADLWQKTHGAALSSASAAENGWNVWLRRPNSRDIYRFALGEGNLRMGLPMMVYDSIVNEPGEILIDTILRAVPGQSLLSLHNYAPPMAGVSFAGGRMTEGAWPLAQRRHWVKLMSDFKPGTNDFTGYRAALEGAEKFFAREPDVSAFKDASLAGLREGAAVINLGRTEGVGALMPVAVASARDLLNYGWEMTGLQMGTRWRFVQYSWAVPDLARSIYSGVVSDVEGVLPFFVNENTAKSTSYREMLARLQLVDGLQLRVGWSPNAFASEGRANADVFVKRAWLRPRDLDWQVRSLWDDKDMKGVHGLLDYYAENGGAWTAAFALKYLGSLNSAAFREITNGPAFTKRFVEKLPYISEKYVTSIYDTRFKGKDNCQVGQELEKMYWPHPESRLEPRIFRNYALGGANKSAARFYKQARPFIQGRGPVNVSNGIGRHAYLMGYLLGDKELRKAALEDGAAGSHADYELQIYEDVIGGDFAKLRKDVDEMIERYGEGKTPGDPDPKLKAFLPLMDALKDPKHARHAEALRFFAGSPAWPIFRWICIEEFKLPASEGIQFLGGRETDLFRRTLAAYLEKDQRGMLELVNKFGPGNSASEAQTIVSYQLFFRLKGSTPPCDETDLKPKEVESLVGVVAEMLKKRRG